jgi:hypothetical protein
LGDANSVQSYPWPIDRPPLADSTGIFDDLLFIELFFGAWVFIWMFFFEFFQYPPS